MVKEIIFQITRFILIPVVILFFFDAGLSTPSMMAAIFLAISFCYLISLFFLIFKIRKIKFLEKKNYNLSSEEVKGLKRFLIPLSATALAGMFFGYIDTLMLGHYVQSEFIAYYGAAFGLVGGATAIISFLSISLMPLFARKHGKVLEGVFKKIRNLTILISTLAAIFTYLVAPFLIKVIYGDAYLPAINVLRFFSLLVFLVPIMGIYISYFTTQKKTKTLAWLVLSSAILNIVFNFIAINYGLNFSPLYAVFGACIATILSRIIYLGGLIYFRKR